MNDSSVAIIGAGLAGMSAAETLSRCYPDSHITLLESRRLPGGRAGSYIDPDTRAEVDYCQHAAMGCCTNFLDLLARCDLDSYLHRFEQLTFLHPDYPPSRFAPARGLPAPLHLLGTIGQQRYLSAKQQREIKRGLWKLMRARPGSLESVRATDWLTGVARQSARTIREFWDVILISALGEQTDRVAMSAARKVMIDGFAAAHGASDVLVPTRPLAELFGRRMAAILSGRGVDLRTGQKVTRITPDAEIQTGDQRLRPAAVICAVPWHRIAKLFEGWNGDQRSHLPDLEAISGIPSSPISGLHLWFDAPITDRDHAVMVGTVAQWLFRDPCRGPDENAAESRSSPSGTGYYYQIVISASSEATSVPKSELLKTVLDEIRHAFPAARGARLLNHRLVTDPNSVFSIRPEIEAIRPTAATGLPWLALAGDWTQTGWPATMEGAVISGRLAAKTIAGQLGWGTPQGLASLDSLVSPGLPQGFLARKLIRSPPQAIPRHRLPPG